MNGNCWKIVDEVLVEYNNPKLYWYDNKEILNAWDVCLTLKQFKKWLNNYIEKEVL